MVDDRILTINETYPDVPSGKFQALIIRTFDIVLSVIGLVITAPLFLLIAVILKLDSKGKVFFQDERVGKHMKHFPMYKFRTMLENAVIIDQSVCPKHDPRVTSVGRLLRRTKLNELPQLLNILKGEMSFVGPRPEAPDLAGMYPEEAKRIFSVRPGLVGAVVASLLRGSISGRNEEELYPPGVDPKRYYIEHILPEKLKIDLKYLSRQTVGNYLRIIIVAAKETVLGALGVGEPSRGRRQLYLFAADFALSQISYAFAYWLSLQWAGTNPSLTAFISGLLLIMMTRSIVYYGLGLYNFVMPLITLRDVIRVSQAVGLGSLLLLILNEFSRINHYPPLLALVDFCLLSAILMSIRLFMMFRFRRRDKIRVADRKPRVVIFGANAEGLKALYTLGGSKKSPYEIVGFIDDAEEKYAKTISGVKVLGNRHHIQALSKLHNIQEVILAPDDKTHAQLDEVVTLCAQAGIRSQIFSRNIDDDTFERSSYPLRPLSLSDLMPQVKVSLDETVLRSILPGKTVLMLGSGLELGSAICRYIFSSGCRKIVIVDRYESRLNEILAELASDFPGFQIVPVVLDSQDREALNKVFVLHSPQIVIHAGMRKFVPFRQSDDEEIARSNYARTFNLAKVSAQHGCEYFVVISSIKATRGGNFLSDSLRIAEISLGQILGQTATRLIVSRVGNIIENRGGIVSWLNDQILERRPVRLPAETAKAFLLSKNAAARSVLQALTVGSTISPGGLLLNSEPGICLDYTEVARKIANFYGIRLGIDIPLKFGGIPDPLVHDEPSAVMASNDKAAAKALRNCLESNQLYRMIEDMISGDPRRLSAYDWYRQTQEIISLCGTSLFSQSRGIVSN